jgi:hypothetical protein
MANTPFVLEGVKNGRRQKVWNERPPPDGFQRKQARDACADEMSRRGAAPRGPRKQVSILLGFGSMEKKPGIKARRLPEHVILMG